MSERPRGRYCVTTFGCRVNQADSAGIAGQLDKAGLQRSTSPQEADVVVLNTCTVTHRSDADVRKAVSRLRREAPEAKVVVTGCFAQRAPALAAAIPGVSAVVGNAHKSRLPVLAESLTQTIEQPETNSLAPRVVHTPIESHAVDELVVEPVTTVLDKTRPFVKIQDGCDAHCTYCIIPAVRGRARGADPAKVESAVRTLVERKYFEIVLAGIHLGTYAYPKPEGGSETLVSLVRRLLAMPNLGRLRLSCIEPMAFPGELATVAREDPRLAPHFHLPLQSGSDRVLKRMVRPYRAREFQLLLDQIRGELPEACLGTDVIVGFPGESEDDFRETLSFVERSGLNYVHVFSYSDRSGTPSTRLSGKVSSKAIKERASELSLLSEQLWTAYLDRQVGQVRPAVILESDPKRPEVFRALTENFCNVDVEESLLEPGASVRLELIRRNGRRLVGRIA